MKDVAFYCLMFFHTHSLLGVDNLDHQEVPPQTPVMNLEKKFLSDHRKEAFSKSEENYAEHKKVWETYLLKKEKNRN